MTEQQQKLLQEAKDAVAKENGFESFEKFDDKSTFGYNHDTPKIIEKIAIKYQQLCEAEETKKICYKIFQDIWNAQHEIIAIDGLRKNVVSVNLIEDYFANQGIKLPTEF